MTAKTISFAAVAAACLPFMLLAQTAAPMPQGDWLPVPAQSLLIEPGSPLDFSGLVPAGPAGSHGRLVIEGGKLALDSGKPAPRLSCGQLSSDSFVEMRLPTHAESDALAEQVRLHGYSLVRIQNVDQRLRGPSGTAVDPEQLDRFYYQLAALKRNGVSWMLDILSTPGKDIGDGYVTRPSGDDIRVRMIFDPAARARWLGFVDTVFNRANPYTGLSPLADPALSFVIGSNENNLLFYAPPGRPYPTGLGPLFNRWIRARYPDPKTLAAALPDLTAGERGGGAIAPPATPADATPRAALFRQFGSGLELDAYGWMTDRLKERGFVGPLLGYELWYKAIDGRTRAGLPIIDVHAYTGEMTGFETGNSLTLPSSTADTGLNNWLLNTSARWLDRPMMASEYGQPFPNPYRYESGLLFPAIAAFQGYGAICRTAFLAVEPTLPAAGPDRLRLRPYTVGIDPTERATETLATLLFSRGDVAPATSTVAVPFGADQFAQGGSALIPRAINRAALLTRFGLIAQDRFASLPHGSRAVPLGTTPDGLRDKLVSRLTGETGARQAALAADLRADGALPAGNATDPATGRFESQTGQLAIDQRAGTMTIATPRTEAVSTTGAAATIRLGSLTLVSSNAGALVAASSLDGQPVARSRKLLLIVAGDARNSGMGVSGSGESWRIGGWGTLPILMRRIVTDLALRTNAGTRARLSVLSLRGSVIAGNPVAVGDGGLIRLHLDTGAVPASPTTYFLLEIE